MKIALEILKSLGRILLLLAVFGLIIYAWWLTPSLLAVLAQDIVTSGADLSVLGLHGDSYGGVNALFTALALGGAIMAILLQSHEISEMRKEFGQQKHEMIAQKQVMEEHNGLLADQNRLLTGQTTLQILENSVKAHEIDLKAECFKIDGMIPQAVRTTGKNTDTLKSEKAFEKSKKIQGLLKTWQREYQKLGQPKSTTDSEPETEA